MQSIRHYIKENQKQLKQIFTQCGAIDGQLEATKVFQYLQSAFNTKEIKFLENNKIVFNEEDYSQKMETIIQEYYKSTQQGKQGKFYMYRVKFLFEEIVNLIQFWIKKEADIKVSYDKSHLIKQATSPEKKPKENKQKSHQIKQNTQPLHEQNQDKQSDNQFMPDISQIPGIILSYKNEIQKCQKRLETESLTEHQITQLRNKINELVIKIKFLEERLEKSKKVRKFDNQENENKKKNSFQQKIKDEPILDDLKAPSLVKRSSSSLSPAKIQTILRSIFEFYSKQIHVTGVKASFQRIQRQSNTINYQKLVHFLKEYKIFPQSSKDQKKLQHIYLKCSSNTRDLNYEGFVKLLQKLAEIVLPQEHQLVNKAQILKLQIIQQRKKKKILLNPFHSLQKQDFRIDKASLKYEFKPLPLNGKQSNQIADQIQNRRQIKQQIKQQKNRSQTLKKIRFLKKLQNIDPFHPLIQKNKHLIRQKSFIQSQPIISLDNIQMYRDKKFNLKQMFGIQTNDQSLSKVISPNKSSINNSYQIKSRVKQLQKKQQDKMNILMSGIIQRSNAKLQKLGISPRKKSALN